MVLNLMKSDNMYSLKNKLLYYIFIIYSIFLLDIIMSYYSHFLFSSHRDVLLKRPADVREFAAGELCTHTHARTETQTHGQLFSLNVLIVTFGYDVMLLCWVYCECIIYCMQCKCILVI